MIGRGYLRAAYRRVRARPAPAEPAIPPRPTLKPLDGPPRIVETAATPAQLRAMAEHIEERWRQMGGLAPHFSVLTHDDFLPATIAEHEDRFYRTGEGDLAVFLKTASRCGVDLTGYKRCLELGCGVGRVSVWLARQFEEVIAADISDAHLAVAERALARFEATNVRLVCLKSLTLDGLPDCDVVISVIVLQHNPPPIAAMLLNAMLGKLRPGGVAYFQVPTYGPDYAFTTEAYLSQMAAYAGMEMHVLPQPVVFRILRENGCDLLECREDGAVGEYGGFVSNSFLARKQGA